jgi:hypothetical protein
MRRRNGPTRKERRERAEALLKALLRTPKTRAGLIAAAITQEGITKNFVYGWLTEASRTGIVTMLKSTNPVQYQLTSHIVIEKPAEGFFPTWLEPRDLPSVDRRRIYIDGKAVQQLQGTQA